MERRLVKGNWLGYFYLADIPNGEIYDLDGKLMETYYAKDKAPVIIYYDDKGERHQIGKHRLVYNAYEPISHTKFEVNFIDGNKYNSSFGNLKLVTHYDNIQLRELNGMGRGKALKCYTVDGKYVNTFKSATEAAKTLDIDRAGISRSANDEFGTRSVKGYRFTFI